MLDARQHQRHLVAAYQVHQVGVDLPKIPHQPLLGMLRPGPMPKLVRAIVVQIMRAGLNRLRDFGQSIDQVFRQTSRFELVDKVQVPSNRRIVLTDRM